MVARAGPASLPLLLTWMGITRCNHRSCSLELQVMDPDKANSRVKKLSKPDKILVCFFADNEFNWLHRDHIAWFKEKFEEKLRQKGTKAHKVQGVCQHAVSNAEHAYVR